jgi:lysophospholipase L1-like esterase
MRLISSLTIFVLSGFSLNLAPAQTDSAIVAVPVNKHISYDWYQRHADVLAIKDSLQPQIVLIGDSITHYWDGVPKATGKNAVRGPLAWKEAFDDLPVLNLGFGGDRTQNVLWRIEHGEIDGISPKVVVLNIGTNNLRSEVLARPKTPEEIVEGILKICDEIHAKLPHCRLIVMGVFPRGQLPSNPRRPLVLAINDLLAKDLAATRPAIKFLNIDAQFLQPDGSEIPGVMMPDGTHPTEKGYHNWAQALLAAGVRN